jgi:cell division protein FtsB
MAVKAWGSNRPANVKQTIQPRLVLRFTGRITVTALAALIFTLVAIQFARVIGENVAMMRQLSAVRADTAALEKRRAQQRREIERLRDPEGAIPDIHDRLRMVRANETIIFVSPAPTSAP